MSTYRYNRILTDEEMSIFKSMVLLCHREVDSILDLDKKVWITEDIIERSALELEIIARREKISMMRDLCLKMNFCSEELFSDLAYDDILLSDVEEYKEDKDYEKFDWVQ